MLDSSNCSWSKNVVGLPSVMPVRERLAIFYDGLDAALEKSQAGLQHPDAYRHMFRDLGIAYLNLPIRLPTVDAASATHK